MTEAKQATDHIGKCALCDQESVVLKESHSIPKFVYQWIKETSPTPYLRASDNVNIREQDGPKEYLLCGPCEGKLSVMETELSERMFKKIANYRNQQNEIIITENIRVGVLSIFWRTLLTSLNRDNGRTKEDDVLMRTFLASAKAQIRQGFVTTPIYVAPFYGDPPFFNLPVSMTYLLDRMVGAPDIRFFDKPHRYYSVFKLPFMFFYVPSEGWAEHFDAHSRFSGTVRLSEIKNIPKFLRSYIIWLAKQFETSKQSMSCESLEKIMRDTSKNKKITGADKSMARSKFDKS